MRLGAILASSALMIGLAAAPASAARPPINTQHDFACGVGRAAVTLTVCEHTTGQQGMTPMIAINSRGTEFMTVATTAAVVTDPGILTGDQPTYLLRSRDDGRHWTKIRLPHDIVASEADIYIDKATDRLYAWSMSYDLMNCGYQIAWTDNEGDTWQEATRRPGCFPLSLGDWPKLFTGPFPKGVAHGAYPSAVYSCNYVPNVLVAASLACWTSYDGGKTFPRFSFLPVLNGVCLATDGKSTVHGNGPETIVHGTGTVLRDGTVVIPVMLCGRIIVVRSTDTGRTWTVRDTGSDSVGWFNFLKNLGTQSGGDNIYNMMVMDNSLAQDGRGNLFLAYPATGGVKLAYSRDGGITWTQRGVISPQGTGMPWLVAAKARGNGQVALSFIATPDHGDPILGTGERFYNWMGYSPNAFTSKFSMATTSPLSTPTLTSGAGISCCATGHYFLEYTGIEFLDATHLRAAFARTRGLPNPVLTMGMATIR